MIIEKIKNLLKKVLATHPKDIAPKGRSQGQDQR